MKKYQKGLVFILVGIMMFSLVACSQKKVEEVAPTNEEKKEATSGDKEVAETPADVETIKLFIAGTSGAEDTQSMAHMEYAKRLIEASDGVIAAEAKINGVMGETDDVTEQAIEGVPVINATDPGRIAAYVNDYGLIQMPYIFPDYTYLNDVMSTDIYKQWEKDFEAKGIKLITSNCYSGVRSWVTNMPVEKPEDLKGVKIRTIGSDLFVKSVNAMGAVATALPWGETYQGIEQGVVDGTEAQIPGIYSMRFFEVCDYISLSEHFTLIGSMVTGTKFFDSMPEKYQEIVMTQAFETYRDNQQIVVDKSKEYIVEMESEGMTILEIDKTPFVEAVQPVYDEMNYSEIRDQLYAELGLN